jgi:tRNA U34 5-methylaminomethyl-2-thiouridine-forming methyltransferase MnmC
MEFFWKPALMKSADGSHTLYVEALNEHYHSVHGAIQESLHVFIHACFNHSSVNPVKIFEIGFGTGLNAILTFIETDKTDKIVVYHSIELYPIENQLADQLNYPEFLPDKYGKIFKQFHKLEWNKQHEIEKNFYLNKIQADLISYPLTEMYDIIYFDAFSPEKQPELWSESVFKKLFEHLNYGGILTTYSAKGLIKQRLRQVGFHVERLKGPPGKWQMIRATKI